MFASGIGDTQWLYDFEELERRMREAGFTQIESVAWGESKYPELRARETPPHVTIRRIDWGDEGEARVRTGHESHTVRVAWALWARIT